jgi:hypothetical protein
MSLLISEHREQVMLVTWFKFQYAKYKDCFFAIPNGAHLAGDAKSRAIKIKKMKAEGFLVGVSDLFFMIPKGGWHGLFIEMKSEKGSASEAQSDFIGRAVLMGYRAEVCNGFDEAKLVIDNYLRGDNS